MKTTINQNLLKLFAFLVPMYMIFYPLLQQEPDNPFAKSLKKYIWAGFSFYSVLAIVIITSVNT